MTHPDPDVYLQVRSIAEEIVQNSKSKDTQYFWQKYQTLRCICESNANTCSDHPFQWEALGDFTPDRKQSIRYYQRALDLAEKMGLSDYIDSIKEEIDARNRKEGNDEQPKFVYRAKPPNELFERKH